MPNHHEPPMQFPNASHWLTPDWQPHPAVASFVTTRLGDVSPAPWQGFNLGLNCNDSATRVQQSREWVRSFLGLKHISWLTQVHGTDVVPCPTSLSEADACYSRQPQVACAILTADCLPVLFARQDGSAVAAAHAGWRSLSGGVLENTLNAIAPNGEATSAWLGPAICQTCYQVDDAVRDAFLAKAPASAPAFQADGPGHYRLSLPQAAQLLLEVKGVAVTNSALCTSCDNEQFYSYRKEHGTTGRFASLVWLV